MKAGDDAFAWRGGRQIVAARSRVIVPQALLALMLGLGVVACGPRTADTSHTADEERAEESTRAYRVQSEQDQAAGMASTAASAGLGPTGAPGAAVRIVGAASGQADERAVARSVEPTDAQGAGAAGPSREEALKDCHRLEGATRDECLRRVRDGFRRAQQPKEGGGAPSDE